MHVRVKEKPLGSEGFANDELVDVWTRFILASIIEKTRWVGTFTLKVTWIILTLKHVVAGVLCKV